MTKSLNISSVCGGWCCSVQCC